MQTTLSEITLDLVQENYAVVRAVQYDHKGRTVRVNITDNRDTYVVPDSIEAAIKYKKPDGNGIFNFCTVKDGHIEFVFDEEMLAVAGTCHACIVLMEDDVTLSSMTFTIIIESMPLPNKEIESSYEYDVLTQLITNQEENLNKTKVCAEAAKKSETNAAASAKTAADTVGIIEAYAKSAENSEKKSSESEKKSGVNATNAETSAQNASASAKKAQDALNAIDGYKGTSYNASREAIVFTTIATQYDSQNESIKLEV